MADHQCSAAVLKMDGFDYVDDAVEWVDMGNGGIEAVYECPTCGDSVAFHLAHEANYVREDGEWIAEESGEA